MEAKIDQFGPVFLQKVHVNMDLGNVLFCWPSYSLFWASKLAVFDGPPHFSGIEGRISRIEGSKVFSKVFRPVLRPRTNVIS